MKPRAKKRTSKRCEASTPICSGELVRFYSVNGSEEKTGEVFHICGPCRVYLERGGAKLKAATA